MSAGAQAPLEANYQSAVAAYADGRFAEAETLFAAVADRDPVFDHDGDGSARYWLGRVHLARGDTLNAFAEWSRALAVLDHHEAFDPALADAFVRTTFGARLRDAYPRAAMLFLQLLDDSPVAPRHQAQAAFLARDGESVSPGWWGPRDPLPATAWNERLFEHLERVSVAEQMFGDADDERLFDDRGEVFVRYGAPNRRTRIVNFELLKIFAGESAFVPENELWVYENLGPYGHYLFVKESGRYRRATTLDLMPDALRDPFQSSRHSRGASVMAIGMHEVYRQLAQHSSVYVHMLSKLSDLRDRLTADALEAGTRVDRLLSSASMDVSAGLSVELFDEIRGLDDAVEAVRRDSLQSSVTRIPDELPLIARSARFLEEDQTTRVDVFWAIPPDEDGASPSRIRVTAIEYDVGYDRRQVHRSAIDLGATDRYAVTSLRGVGDPFHVAVQVDQSRSEETAAYQAVRSGVYRRDSVRALRSDPARLEMSDLVPMELGRGEMTPFMRSSVAPGNALGLRFEVYNLTYDSDDLVHYRVDYAISRRRDVALLARLFGKSEKVVVSGSADYAAAATRTAETIHLDLGELTAGTVLRIDVTVTDLVTNRSVERALHLPVRTDE